MQAIYDSYINIDFKTQANYIDLSTYPITVKDVLKVSSHARGVMMMTDAQIEALTAEQIAADIDYNRLQNSFIAEIIDDFEKNSQFFIRAQIRTAKFRECILSKFIEYSTKEWINTKSNNLEIVSCTISTDDGNVIETAEDFESISTPITENETYPYIFRRLNDVIPKIKNRDNDFMSKSFLFEFRCGYTKVVDNVLLNNWDLLPSDLKEILINLTAYRYDLEKGVCNPNIDIMRQRLLKYQNKESRIGNFYLF